MKERKDIAVTGTEDFRMPETLDEVLVRENGRYRFGNGFEIDCPGLSPDGQFFFLNSVYAAIQSVNPAIFMVVRTDGSYFCKLDMTKVSFVFGRQSFGDCIEMSRNSMPVLIFDVARNALHEISVRSLVHLSSGDITVFAEDGLRNNNSRM